MSASNSITLIGNMGRDIETRNVGETIVGKFSLATTSTYMNKQGEKVKDTQWHTIEAWGKKAELLQQYTEKGHRLAISGELRYDKYTNKDGYEVTAAKVVLQDFMFLQSSKSEQETLTRTPAPVEEEPGNVAADDDLPF